MHETDAFRKTCKTEVIARWWLPQTVYCADYQRDGLFRVWCNGCCMAMSSGNKLESSAKWAASNGYVRLGD